MNPDIEADINQDLSALLDGELDAQRSRFLWQRIAHDPALRQRWERWQLVSSCLKGEAVQPLPIDFSTGVLATLEQLDNDAPTAQSNSTHVRSTQSRRSLRWIGGAALAASVGLAALLLRQTTPTPQIVADASPPHVAIQPIHIALPEPQVALKLQLPIPEHGGVVGVYRSPLHPAVAASGRRAQARFSPFPQPYAIDPELEAYLAQQKSSASSGSRDAGNRHAGVRDVFSEHNVYLPTGNQNALGTVSWSPDGER